LTDVEYAVVPAHERTNEHPPLLLASCSRGGCGGCDNVGAACVFAAAAAVCAARLDLGRLHPTLLLRLRLQLAGALFHTWQYGLLLRFSLLIFKPLPPPRTRHLCRLLDGNDFYRIGHHPPKRRLS
jgi:hypothetical protein